MVKVTFLSGVCVCVYARALSHTVKCISFLVVKISNYHALWHVLLGLYSVTATSPLLSLTGMQNPVRSRLCQAARYFLKEADFDIGGYPCFHFDDGAGLGQPFALEYDTYKSVHFGLYPFGSSLSTPLISYAHRTP